MTIEVFLDDTPGELRAVVERDGRPEHILIERPDDVPQIRLGARSVARVRQSAPGLKGAFVDLGGGQDAFMPIRSGVSAPVGAKVEVEISAERREAKAPVARWLGAGQGEIRLLAAGPTLMQTLAILAPGVEPVTGRDAIEAGWRAVDEAQAMGDLAQVERTRAMITVDVDLNAHDMGRARPRDETNRLALREAARRIRLNRWGGLVAVDLIGTQHDGKAILAALKAAFGDDPAIVHGPVNRFGVLMLSLPWRRTPLEEILYADARRRILRPEQAAQEAVRRLRFALLEDTTRARVRLCVAPGLATAVTPLVAQLGPRAHLKTDDGLRAGDFVVEAE